MSANIEVHDPLFFASFMPRKVNSFLHTNGPIDKKPYIFLSLLVLALGATLVGFRVGGINGMIGAGASAGAIVLSTAFIYHAKSAFQNAQDYTADELIQYLSDEHADKEREPKDILEGFTMEGMVEFIHCLKDRANSLTSQCLEYLYGEIVQSDPRDDIPGRILEPGDESEEGTTWDAITTAVLAEYPDDLEFLQTIRKTASLIGEED